MACGQMKKPSKVQLKAVRMLLESFQERLVNKRVRWFTDNQNVVRIVQYGSKKPDLQAEAMQFSQYA